MTTETTMQRAPLRLATKEEILAALETPATILELAFRVNDYPWRVARVLLKKIPRHVTKGDVARGWASGGTPHVWALPGAHPSAMRAALRRYVGMAQTPSTEHKAFLVTALHGVMRNHARFPLAEISTWRIPVLHVRALLAKADPAWGLELRGEDIVRTVDVVWAESFEGEDDDGTDAESPPPSDDGPAAAQTTVDTPAVPCGPVPCPPDAGTTDTTLAALQVVFSRPALSNGWARWVTTSLAQDPTGRELTRACEQMTARGARVDSGFVCEDERGGTLCGSVVVALPGNRGAAILGPEGVVYLPIDPDRSALGELYAAGVAFDRAYPDDGWLHTSPVRRLRAMGLVVTPTTSGWTVTGWGTQVQASDDAHDPNALAKIAIAVTWGLRVGGDNPLRDWEAHTRDLAARQAQAMDRLRALSPVGAWTNESGGAADTGEATPDTEERAPSADESSVTATTPEGGAGDDIRDPALLTAMYHAGMPPAVIQDFFQTRDLGSPDAVDRFIKALKARSEAT